MSVDFTCFLLLNVGLWCVINQKVVKRKGIRKDEISDIAASDADGIYGYRFPILHCHLCGFQVGIHRHVQTGDCPMDDCAIFKLNGHSFIAELHQKSTKRHH